MARLTKDWKACCRRVIFAYPWGLDTEGFHSGGWVPGRPRPSRWTAGRLAEGVSGDTPNRFSTRQSRYVLLDGRGLPREL